MKHIASIFALGLVLALPAAAKSPVGHICTDGITASTEQGQIAGYRDAKGIYTYKGVPKSEAKRS